MLGDPAPSRRSHVPPTRPLNTKGQFNRTTTQLDDPAEITNRQSKRIFGIAPQIEKPTIIEPQSTGLSELLGLTVFT